MTDRSPRSEVGILQATVELKRSVNVKFDVEKLLDQFIGEWSEWQRDCKDDYDTELDMVKDFVQETIAELGYDLLDFNDWVIPEPMYDDFETDVRFRNA